MYNIKPKPLATVDGWAINLPDLETSVRDIIAGARAGEGFSVVTLNADHLVKLRRDPAFQDAYAAARFVTADGEPVARIARVQHPAIQRTTGADLLLPLAEAASREDIPIYLFGTTSGVLARAGERLSQFTNGTIDIAGSDAPGPDFDPMGKDADRALDAIRQSGAKLCFVALGAPKQEIFAARAVAFGLDIGFICVGAALDFLVGQQTRAPKFFQNHGLEWSWRLATQPLRLAPRYARCALVLADIVVRGGAWKHRDPRSTAAS